MEKVKKSRRRFSAAFKAKVAVEALKEKETLAVLAKKFGVHANQISAWKQEFLEKSSGVFESKAKKEAGSDPDTEALYSKIGKLEMENDFLKKSLKRCGAL